VQGTSASYRVSLKLRPIESRVIEQLSGVARFLCLAVLIAEEIMKVTVFPSGSVANESESLAIEHLNH